MKEETGREKEENGGETSSSHGKKGGKTGNVKDRKEKKAKKDKKDKKPKHRSADGASSSTGKKSAARTKAVQGKSKRIASVDTDLCYGCGKCVKVCKVKAISLIPRT